MGGENTSTLRKWVARIVGALLLFYCAVVGLFILEASKEQSVGETPKLAMEVEPSNEAEATKRLIANLQAVLTQSYPPPKRTLRDAHPKQHGLVKAEFIVLNDLKSDLRVGFFEKPKSYEAWIRFSSLVDTADTNKIAKGMGIKVMGVEGRKVLPGHRQEFTQDFVFMSTPFFVAKDVSGFADLVEALTSGKGPTMKYFLTHPRTFMLLRKTGQATPDILDVEWGSTTPYKFGDRAVKYAVRARDPGYLAMPEGNGHNDFLRNRLADRLSKDEVWLDFFVQFQTDPEAMPIEDPRVIWDAPLVQVASIRIPKQNFNTAAQQLYGDTLSFTPWHALPEHRPLGGINRGRKVIYNVMSKFRHDRNGEPVFEPENWSDFSRFEAERAAATE